jgi:cell division protein FtsI (penicillin-binding protein 3)
MALLSCGVLTLLIARVVDVQGVSASSYSAYGQSEQYEKVSTPAIRGTIYDRNGNVLATSVPRSDVVADDYLVHPASMATSDAPELARLLGLSDSTVVAKLREQSGYVPLALAVSQSTATKVESLGLPFLSFVPDQVREDPTGDLFSPVLGAVGWGNKGLSGVEYLYQQQLAGRPGLEELMIGAAGDELPGSAKIFRRAVQGTGLVLTLDEPLQYEVTRALSAEILQQAASEGACVVLDTHTGGILAMVSLVRQHAQVVPAEQNLATNTVYQPGSVMKLATVSGALQEGLITPSTEFTVPFTTYVGGWPFQDAEYHPTQQMPVSQILAQSSNVGTIEIAHLLGASRLEYFLHDLGFGKKTALDWPGESAGILPTPSESAWSAADMGTLPIGTGEAVTALQIVSAYNAVANGGVYVAPHLVETEVGPNGTEHVIAPPASHRVLDRSTVAELVPMLEGVTATGTGTLAQIPSYAVAGKTGTAQIPSTTGPGYQPGAWNATFVGFVPAGNPQLTAIVFMSHPNAMYGGSASAPVFATIMKYALRHFDISPNGASGGLSANPDLSSKP